MQTMEEIKRIYALPHYNLKIFPKYRNRLAPHHHRMLLLKWPWHLLLVKIALVDLCPYAGSQVLKKNLQQFILKTTMLDLGGLQRPLNTWHCGDRLPRAETGRWLPDWDIICVLKIEGM